MAHALETELHQQFERLEPAQQRKVLDFTKALANDVSSGSSGNDLISFANSIDSNDLKLISDAIEVGCEQVNMNDW